VRACVCACVPGNIVIQSIHLHGCVR